MKCSRPSSLHFSTKGSGLSASLRCCSGWTGGYRLLLALTFPLMIIITLTFGSLSRQAFRRIRAHLAGINAFLQEAISGISIIQIFLREKDAQERFSRLNKKYFDAAMYQIRVFGVFVPLIEVMSSVSLALIIWYGGGQVLKNYMTIGVLTAFISYMRLFFQPIREFSQKYTIVQSAMASAERIFQLLEEKDYVPAGCRSGGNTRDQGTYRISGCRVFLRCR